MKIEKVLKPLPDESRCALSWKDLAYFIPLTDEQKSLVQGKTDLIEMGKLLAQRDDDERGLPIPTVTSNKKL